MRIFFSRKFYCILLMLTGMIMAANNVWSQSGTPGLEKIDKPIRKHESDLEKLESGLKIHFGELKVIGEQEFNLLDQIEDLDRNVALQKIRLDVMIERLNSQEELLIIKKRDLKQALQNKDIVKEHLKTRLRSFYLMGKTGVLNVTFSTRTLPDLMLFTDSFKTLLDYDKKLFDEYRETIEELTAAQDAHKKESALLNTFISKAVEQQQKLDTLLLEKRALLQKVKTQKVLHEQAIMEMKKAEAELRNVLVELKKKRSYTIKGFVLNKGRMIAPVQGDLVSRFGETKEGDGIATGETKGITIDAPNGAPIRAIFAGRVIFAGYRKGFGNMVIIDHGLDYYSITARIEQINVREGQEVSAGDIIGRAGDIATLFEKGVYFEIRNDTEPLDPLEWISLEG